MQLDNKGGRTSSGRLIMLPQDWNFHFTSMCLSFISLTKHRTDNTVFLSAKGILYLMSPYKHEHLKFFQYFSSTITQ